MLYLEAKAFYLEAFNKITSVLKLDDKENLKLWKALTILQPVNRNFNDEHDMKNKLNRLRFLAMSNPLVILPCEVTPLMDEWKKYAVLNLEPPKDRLDTYWCECLKLNDFPLLDRFVKAFLCIQPHNAAEERGFSVNSSIVTKERNRLKPKVLTSIRRVRSYLKNIGGLSKFKLTSSLLDAGRLAAQKYIQSYKNCEDDSDTEELPRKASRSEPGTSN